MDPDECLVCGQPTNNCFYSNRRANSFEIVMTNAFEDLVAVPCHVREQINTFLLHGKWLIAECSHGETYHMYVEKTESRSYLCGPYWRSLVQAYGIEFNNIVRFNVDSQTSEISVEVLDIDRVEKRWVQFPDCREVVDCCKYTMEKTYFSDITSISNDEMNAVNFAFLKEVAKPDDDSYIEFFEVPQFFVTRLLPEYVNHLEIPYEIALGYTSPKEGYCILSSRAIHGDMLTSYAIIKGEHICVQDGWGIFCNEGDVFVGDLLVIKIEERENCIRLEVEVIRDEDNRTIRIKTQNDLVLFSTYFLLYVSFRIPLSCGCSMQPILISHWTKYVLLYVMWYFSVCKR